MPEKLSPELEQEVESVLAKIPVKTQISVAEELRDKSQTEHDRQIWQGLIDLLSSFGN